MVTLKASDSSQLPQRDTWAFEALKDLLIREKGFDLEAYKERCILRRIYLKVRSCGHSSLGQYFRVLRRDTDALEELFQYLTIHVTEFFRNPSAFQYLQNNIIPRLLSEGSGSERLNIWSAGCSSGEEPYSLAILMHKALKGSSSAKPFHVLATDVDTAVIRKARKGWYKQDALKNMPGEEREAFFLPDEEGFRVTDEIRRSVTFRVANVLTDRPDGHLDLIVCRNLLIYLSREKQEKVITNFSRYMKKGGYLMLGKAETLIGRNRMYFQNISPIERIYKKRDVPLEEDPLVPRF